MRKLLNRSLLTLGAAIVAVVLATSAAFAAVWTVSGSPPDGNVTFTGETTFSVQDASGTQSLTCLTVIVANLPDGTSSGPQIGSIISISFSSCSLSGVIPFTVTAGGLPYAFNALSLSGNDLNGTITGPIALQFSSSVGCSATVSGTTVPFIYHNDSFQLEIPGTGQDLVLSGVNVAGCQNTLHPGDPVSIRGTYDADEPVVISENP